MSRTNRFAKSLGDGSNFGIKERAKEAARQQGRCERIRHGAISADVAHYEFT